MYMSWKASMEGDDIVKQKMLALLDVQKRGFDATAQNQMISRGARAELLEHTRAVTTLTRSWEVAHPSLDLFTRSMSGLGSAAHAVLSVMTAINILTLTQTEKEERLRDAQSKLTADTVKYNDTLKIFGANHPLTIKAFEDMMQDELEVKKATNALNDSWKDWAVTIAGVMVILGQMRRVLTDVTAMIAFFKELDLGPLGAAFLILARYLPVIAAVAPGIGILIDNLLKVTSLQDLWTKFAHDNPLFIIAERTIIDLMKIVNYIVAFGIMLKRHWQEIWMAIFKFGDEIRVFFTETIPGWFHDTFVKIGLVVSKKVEDIIGIFKALKTGSWDQVYKLAKDLVFGSLWPEMANKMFETTRDMWQNIKTITAQAIELLIGKFKDLKNTTETILTQSVNIFISQSFRIIGQINSEIASVAALIAMYERLARSRGGGGGGSWRASYPTSSNPFQEGGIIPEPVIGKGVHTGQIYTFAESGPEQVIPTNKIWNTTNKRDVMITINNYISGSMIKESDLVNTVNRSIAYLMAGQLR